MLASTDGIRRFKRGPSGSRSVVPLLVLLLLSLAAAGRSEDPFVRETAGWHIVRPGQSLEELSRLYLGEDGSWHSLVELNPSFSGMRLLAAGDRIRVVLTRGLPQGGSLVTNLTGDAHAYPTPVDWTKGRRFDLLQPGDGFRTGRRSSAVLVFDGLSQLLIGEESLVFLAGASEAPPAEPTPSADLEIVVGQVDLQGSRSREDESEIEVILGATRLAAAENQAGELRTRVRRREQGAGQVMVFRGRSFVTQAGQTQGVPEGSGLVLPTSGPIPSPEPLLVAPRLLGPAVGTTVALDRAVLSWAPVSGASSYTVEVCYDVDCGSLALRILDLTQGVLPLAPLAQGRYYWRVTAVAPSGLDGYPSAGRSLWLTARSSPPEGVATATLVGTVRDRLANAPLAGAVVRIPETGQEVWTDHQGGFRFEGLPDGVVTLEAEVEGYLPGRLERITARPGRSTALEVWLDSLPTAYAEVVVTPSQVSLGEPVASRPAALSRRELETLPHLADDLFRALPLLPGATANDISAEFHVRGGRRDQVEIRFDGQELYEAHHLRDFDGALSLLAPSAIGSVDLHTGGYPVRFGDRLSAVLEMYSAEPVSEPELEFGLGLLSSRIGTRGVSANQKGRWLAVGRAGSTELAGEFLSGPAPAFWDLLVKGSYAVGPRQSFTVRGLLAEDRLDFQEEIDGEFKEHRTEHRTAYYWGTHQAILTDRLFVDTMVSWSTIDKARLAFEDEEEQRFFLGDERRVEIAELRQDWSAQARPDHFLGWGWSLRQYEANYQSSVVLDFETPLAALRSFAPESVEEYRRDFEAHHLAGYVTDQWRPRSTITVEVGGRYDRHSLTDETLLSPRLNLAWVAGRGTVVRASWGVFRQSHRPHELAVTDGERRFATAERSEQRILSLEHTRLSRSSGRQLAARLEVWDRRIEDPRPRFENLFEPYNNFPELEPERVRIAPTSARAKGAELFLRTDLPGPFDLWGNYSWSRSEDLLEGQWVLRAIDQTHAVNLGLGFALGKWQASLAWRYHTGWPSTPIDFELELGSDGEVEWTPVLGSPRSLRLNDYHRLDLRLSRQVRLRNAGRLELWLDVQNLYDRRNLAGFDFDFDDEARAATQVSEFWPGIVPSLGVSWKL